MEVVFREHANARAGQKFLSLFPGLGYAAGYKGDRLQRRFSLQEIPADPTSSHAVLQCVLSPGGVGAVPFMTILTCLHHLRLSAGVSTR